jgi:hypothetical protein
LHLPDANRPDAREVRAFLWVTRFTLLGDELRAACLIPWVAHSSLLPPLEPTMSRARFEPYQEVS